MMINNFEIMKDRYQDIIDQKKNKLSQNLTQIDRRYKRFFFIFSLVLTTIAGAVVYFTN